MKLPYVACLSCFATIIPSIIVSCGGSGSNSQNISENQKENQFFNVQLSLATSKQSNLEKAINLDTITLHGTYHECAGKLNGDRWKLAKKVGESSNLIVKKDDINCKLKVTGFEFTKKENNADIFHYKIIPPYLLTNTYPTEANEFQTNNPSEPKLYAKSKIDPSHFSSKPTITFILSELKLFDAKEISEVIASINGQIFSVNSNHLAFSKIPAPDYAIQKTKKFKIISGDSGSGDEKRTILYDGEFAFAKTDTAATSYLIVKDNTAMNFFDYKAVDEIFRSPQHEAKKVTVNAQSGDSLNIEAARIARDADLPNQLEKGTSISEKIYIIFANEDLDASNINSYQVAAITIAEKAVAVEAEADDSDEFENLKELEEKDMLEEEAEE